MGLEDGEGFSSSPEDLEDPCTDLEGCHARCTIRSARWDQDFNVNSAVGNTSIPTPVLTPGNMGSLGPIAMEATVSVLGFTYGRVCASSSFQEPCGPSQLPKTLPSPSPNTVATSLSMLPIPERESYLSMLLLND